MTVEAKVVKGQHLKLSLGELKQLKNVGAVELRLEASSYIPKNKFNRYRLNFQIAMYHAQAADILERGKIWN
jgi:hypothetical protein